MVENALGAATHDEGRRSRYTLAADLSRKNRPRNLLPPEFSSFSAAYFTSSTFLTARKSPARMAKKYSPERAA